MENLFNKTPNTNIFKQTTQSLIHLNYQFSATCKPELDFMIPQSFNDLIKSSFVDGILDNYNYSMSQQDRNDLGLYFSEMVTYLYITSKIEDTQKFKEMYLKPFIENKLDRSYTEEDFITFNTQINTILNISLTKILDILGHVVYVMNCDRNQEYRFVNFFLGCVFMYGVRYQVIHDDKNRCGGLIVYKYYNTEDDYDKHPIMLDYKIKK